MPDTLTQEEIENLQKGEKNLPKMPDGRPVMTYDFKHPARVSRDQQRTLENLHFNLARMMAASFSTIQRSAVEVEIAFVDQTTYAEFIASLSNPSCSYTFTIEPLSGPAIVDYSLPVAYSLIERAFGGADGKPPKEARPLTGLERRLMAKVVTRTLAELEATWEALLKIQVSGAELETNPEFMQVAAPSDTVILIAFEVRSQEVLGLVSLCYPYFTLEPVMNYLNIQSWASRERGRRESGQNERLAQLKSVPVELTAVCARGRLSAEDVSSLRVGDTLVLDTRADEPGVLFVEDKPAFLARSGAVAKGQYAVEIARALSVEEVRSHV